MVKHTWPENRERQKMWTKGIKTALAAYNDPKKKIKAGEALFKIGTELVEAAVDRTDPNWQFAVKELGLRLDGKPTEHHEIASTDATTGNLIGISAVFAALEQVTSKGAITDRTPIVQDGLVLSPPVRTKTNGHGKAVDIQPMPDDSK